MSKIFVRMVVVFLLALVFVNADTGTKRYAVITRPEGAILRDSVAANPNMIGPRPIARGQIVEVLGEGKLWLHVRYDKPKYGEGYIQITDCDIKDGPLKSNPVGWILVAIVLFGTVGVAVYLFYTKKGVIQKEEDIV